MAGRPSATLPGATSPISWNANGPKSPQIHRALVEGTFAQSADAGDDGAWGMAG